MKSKRIVTDFYFPSLLVMTSDRFVRRFNWGYLKFSVRKYRSYVMKYTNRYIQFHPMKVKKKSICFKDVFYSEMIWDESIN